VCVRKGRKFLYIVEAVFVFISTLIWKECRRLFSFFKGEELELGFSFSEAGEVCAFGTAGFYVLAVHLQQPNCGAQGPSFFRLSRECITQ
jgi:hypothetical protein